MLTPLILPATNPTTPDIDTTDIWHHRHFWHHWHFWPHRSSCRACRCRVSWNSLWIPWWAGRCGPHEDSCHTPPLAGMPSWSPSPGHPEHLHHVISCREGGGSHDRHMTLVWIIILMVQYTYIHIIHAYTHAHIHTYTHMYIHIHTWGDLLESECLSCSASQSHAHLVKQLQVRT